MKDLLANAMPIQGLIGGLMIGMASAIMLSGLGRIARVSGLAVSGMADPQRVRGFLDLFGAWDPTLAFVMGAP